MSNSISFLCIFKLGNLELCTVRLQLIGRHFYCNLIAISAHFARRHLDHLAATVGKTLTPANFAMAHNIVLEGDSDHDDHLLRSVLQLDSDALTSGQTRAKTRWTPGTPIPDVIPRSQYIAIGRDLRRISDCFEHCHNGQVERSNLRKVVARILLYITDNDLKQMDAKEMYKVYLEHNIYT
ncbi:hypothetical protein HDE_01631 [Halotydeus destructor]|nr:hypothetical protein HDE_01631 [Halotydeus destructor]